MKKAFPREGFFYALEKKGVSTMAGNEVENFPGRCFSGALNARKFYAQKPRTPAYHRESDMKIFRVGW